MEITTISHAHLMNFSEFYSQNKFKAVYKVIHFIHNRLDNNKNVIYLFNNVNIKMF